MITSFPFLFYILTQLANKRKLFYLGVSEGLGWGVDGGGGALPPNFQGVQDENPF